MCMPCHRLPALHAHLFPHIPFSTYTFLHAHATTPLPPTPAPLHAPQALIRRPSGLRFDAGGRLWVTSMDLHAGLCCFAGPDGYGSAAPGALLARLALDPGTEGLYCWDVAVLPRRRGDRPAPGLPPYAAVGVRGLVGASGAGEASAEGAPRGGGAASSATEEPAGSGTTHKQPGWHDTHGTDPQQQAAAAAAGQLRPGQVQPGQMYPGQGQTGQMQPGCVSVPSCQPCQQQQQQGVPWGASRGTPIDDEVTLVATMHCSRTLRGAKTDKDCRLVTLHVLCSLGEGGAPQVRLAWQHVAALPPDIDHSNACCVDL